MASSFLIKSLYFDVRNYLLASAITQNALVFKISNGVRALKYQFSKIVTIIFLENKLACLGDHCSIHFKRGFYNECFWKENLVHAKIKGLP